jgi:hypothetical protein
VVRRASDCGASEEGEKGGVMARNGGDRCATEAEAEVVAEAEATVVPPNGTCRSRYHYFLSNSDFVLSAITRGLATISFSLPDQL